MISRDAFVTINKALSIILILVTLFGIIYLAGHILYIIFFLALIPLSFLSFKFYNTDKSNAYLFIPIYNMIIISAFLLFSNVTTALNIHSYSRVISGSVDFSNWWGNRFLLLWWLVVPYIFYAGYLSEGRSRILLFLGAVISFISWLFWLFLPLVFGT